VALGRVGTAPAEPAQPVRLTAEQQKQLEQARTLGEQALKLWRQKKPGEAISAWQKKLELERKVLGQDHPTVAASLGQLARLHEVQNDFAAAGQALRAVLDIQTRRFGKDHWQVTDARLAVADMELLGRLKPEQRDQLRQARVLNVEIVRLWRASRFQEALPLARKALAIHAVILGTTHPDYAKSLFNVAAQYEGLKQVPRALPFLEQAATVLKERLGANHPWYGLCTHRLGELYYERSDFARARRYYEQALAARKQALGEDHPQTTHTRRNLANVYALQGQYPRAEALFQQVLAVTRRLKGEQHPDYASDLFALGLLYTRQGDYLRAEKVAEQACRILRRAGAEKGPLYPLCLAALAKVYLARGAYGRAEELYKQALAVPQQTQDGSTIILEELGQLYLAMDAPARARPLLEKALEVRRQAGEERHPRYVATLNNLGLVYSSLGEYEKAETFLEKSSRITRETVGEKSPDYATALNSLALLYSDLGLHARAETLLLRARDVTRQALGEKHPDYSVRLHNLALHYDAIGDYARAEQLFRESLRIREQALGKDHPTCASSLQGLALLYVALGAPARAEPLLVRALEIEKRSEGETTSYAGDLTNLAQVYQRLGDHRKVEDLLRRALAIYRRERGERHNITGTILNSLAMFYLDTGRLDQAESLFRKALEVKKQALGADHREYAILLHNLARVQQRRGDLARAEAALVEASEITRKAVGENHPSLAISLEALAVLYAGQGRWDGATRAFDRARHTLSAHAARVLPGLSELEQLVYLHKEDRPILHNALSLAFHRRTDPGLAERSAAWLLNGKALTQEVLAENARLVRAGAGPELSAPFKELLVVRRQLANLTFTPAPRGQEADRRQRLARLVEREEQLVKQLGWEAGRLVRSQPWVDLARVRSALPVNAVLIDLFKLDVHDFPPRNWPRPVGPRYVAWVVPAAGQGQVQLIDLGEAAVLEAAVKAARQALQAAPAALKARGERAAEKEARAALQGLSRFLLQPLARHIDRAEHWVISPDAALWLVPWAALPLADGSYAIEKHPISHVVSGRDLVLPPRKGATGAPLILADPDFDRRPPRASQGRTAVLGRGSAVSAERLPLFARLPGTAAEARAIAPLLKRLAGNEPVVRTGKEAREEVIKAARQPRLVVLSTHGFFLEDQEDAIVPLPGPHAARGIKLVEQEQPRSRKRQGKVLENPLLRCGLALAGANHRLQTPEGNDDGILTGLEIVGIDLRGTELVVLSACETGLGRVRNGEGVAGLRQAFQLAGARAVLATLWQIPDAETTELMQGFFAHLASKQNKAEALRQAQLDLIGKRRTRGKSAHPFYWAAFTLTGQWR
jgi:CHAT domain-containing protein/Tfp pilus assembly protein PilF